MVKMVTFVFCVFLPQFFFLKKGKPRPRKESFSSYKGINERNRVEGQVYTTILEGHLSSE